MTAKQLAALAAVVCLAAIFGITAWAADLSRVEAGFMVFGSMLIGWMQWRGE